jgi:hypothetical protein
LHGVTDNIMTQMLVNRRYWNMSNCPVNWSARAHIQGQRQELYWILLAGLISHRFPCIRTHGERIMNSQSVDIRRVQNQSYVFLFKPCSFHGRSCKDRFWWVRKSHN